MSVRATIESDNIPPTWTVFRSQASAVKGKAVGMIVVGIVVILVSLWLLPDPNYGIAGVVGIGFGIYAIVWKGFKKMKRSGFGAVAVTDGELVLVQGGKETSYALTSIEDTELVNERGVANQPVMALYVTVGGKRTRFVRGNDFGDPAAIRSAIAMKVSA